MNVRMRFGGIWQLLASASLMLASAQGHANGDWEKGNILHGNNNCATCHTAKYNATIVAINTAIQNQPLMNLFSSTGTSPLSVDDISDISAYLNHPTFPLATLDQSSFTFTSLSAELIAQRRFRVTNSGTANLIVTGASVTGGSGYSLDASNCTAGSLGFTPPSNGCDVVVTFAPTAATDYNGRTLTVNFSNTFSGSKTATLNGTGLQQFTVSTGLLEFTPATAPDGVRHLIVTDNKGDRIRLCRTDASTFNVPADFTLDAPFTLDSGTKCFTTTMAITPPARPIDVRVHFTNGGEGPRNAVLTIQRVDGSGNVLGIDVANVQLHGNPGALATVDHSTLYDHPELGDPPGVEIDHDATLDRSVTIFSQGSDPLVFTSSAFTIIGASASEYTVQPTGCAAIAGLASGATSPAPSCMLTVRFNPAGLDTRAAELQIAVSGAPTRTVQLNGVGIFGPRLVVSQTSGPVASGDTLPFGPQTIGGLFASRLLTLRNGGTLGNLDVVVPASSSTQGYTITSDATCATLAPAAQCSVTLHFDPTLVQPYNATLVLQSRPAGNSIPTNFNVQLTGQGVVFVLPGLVWTDASGTPITSYAFGMTDVGSPPPTVTVRLRNDGPGGAAVNFVNAVGAGASSYVIDASACNALYRLASCAVTIEFAPGTAGTKAATLQGVAAAGLPSVGVLATDFMLSGTGRGAPSSGKLVASTTALTFDAVAGSASLALELTVTNGSSNAMQILGYDITAGYTVDKKTCPDAPFLLAAGSQCAVSVTFHPQAAGTSQGTLKVRIEGQATTLDIALSGNAGQQADVSSGGCSIVVGVARFDPLLWLLMLGAAGVLWHQSRTRRPRRVHASMHRRYEQPNRVNRAPNP